MREDRPLPGRSVWSGSGMMGDQTTICGNLDDFIFSTLALAGNIAATQGIFDFFAVVI